MYAKTVSRHESKLRQILQSNTVAAMYTHESFTYKGVYYSFEFTAPRYKTNRLLPELHASMDELLAESKHIEYTEKPYIVGFFSRVLNSSNSLLDYEQLLPDCIRGPVHSMLATGASLPRELTDEQVLAFQEEHKDWIKILRKRMVLDLILL